MTPTIAGILQFNVKTSMVLPSSINAAIPLRYVLTFHLVDHLLIIINLGQRKCQFSPLSMPDACWYHVQ